MSAKLISLAAIISPPQLQVPVRIEQLSKVTVSELLFPDLAVTGSLTGEYQSGLLVIPAGQRVLIFKIPVHDRLHRLGALLRSYGQMETVICACNDL
jgi:hypothetical protein